MKITHKTKCDLPGREILHATWKEYEYLGFVHIYHRSFRSDGTVWQRYIRNEPPLKVKKDKWRFWGRFSTARTIEFHKKLLKTGWSAHVPSLSEEKVSES